MVGAARNLCCQMFVPGGSGKAGAGVFPFHRPARQSLHLSRSHMLQKPMLFSFYMRLGCRLVENCDLAKVWLSRL